MPYRNDLNNNVIKTTDKIGSEVQSEYNLALNRPAVSSSNETVNLTPEKAFDGNHLTRWSSKYSDSQWIYVDLGSVMDIKRVVLNWETAYGKAYDIQISDDASNWTTVYSTENGDGGVDDIRLSSTARGRYVRMYGRARGYTAGYSLWDFEVYNDSPSIIRYDYDKDNRAKNVWINGGGSVSYSYDGIGRLKNRTIDTGSGKYVTSYEYDANGNISKAIISDGRSIEYQYDELNQLKRENNGINGITTVYTYDKGGNILTKTEYPYTTGTVGTATKVYNYSYEDANWKDLLTGFDGKDIAYDAIGNPTSYDGWSFTWEEGRQLKSIVKTGQDISFKYNDAGIRTEKTVNGTTTSYRLVGDKVTFETNGTDKIYYSYDSAGDLVSMNLNGVEYYYIRNAQGDIIGLLDGNGSQVVSYSYDTWGKRVSISGSLASTVGEKNPYRYRGYRNDSETGLYYLQSRYYNPEWGRFINADALIGQTGELLGHNLFAYCKNNPVNNFDPDGRRAIISPMLEYDTVVKIVVILSTIFTVTRKAIGHAISNAFDSAVSSIKILIKSNSKSESEDYEDSKARGVPTRDHTVVPHKPSGNKNPNKGKPNSSNDLLNEDGSVKQRRFYGRDGKPDFDIDFNHDGEESHVFPHSHTWDWSQEKPRQPWKPWAPEN